VSVDEAAAVHRCSRPCSRRCADGGRLPASLKYHDHQACVVCILQDIYKTYNPDGNVSIHIWLIVFA
jgi:hypothetical protein